MNTEQSDCLEKFLAGGGSVFFILDTYAAFVGKRKKILTKFIKIIDKKTKPVYDETIISRL